MTPNPEAIAWRFTVWPARGLPYQRTESTQYDQVVRECEEWMALLKQRHGGTILVQYQASNGEWVEQVTIEVSQGQG